VSAVRSLVNPDLSRPCHETSILELDTRVRRLQKARAPFSEFKAEKREP
jgi:hypothetical protein